MNDRFEQPRADQPAGWEGARWEQRGTSAGGPDAHARRLESDASGPGLRAPAPPDPLLTRLFGGSPFAVLLRLLLMSLVAGAMLVWLDIHPQEIFRALDRFVQRIWLMGFDAVREVASYVLVGAMIVVPVWLIMRLMNMRGRR